MGKILNLNTDQLSRSANERYKQSILSMIGATADRYPLPEHLEYMVSVKDRLRISPTIMLSIIPKHAHATTADALAYIEATLPAQMDIPEGIRWLADQVTDKGLDLREALKPEDMLPPIQENPGR